MAAAGVTARCWCCFWLLKGRAPQLWGLVWDFPSHFQLWGRAGTLSRTGGRSGGEGRQSAGHAGGYVAPSRSTPLPLPGRMELLPRLLPELASAPHGAGGLPAAPGGPLLPRRAAPRDLPGPAAPSPQPQPDFPRRPRARSHGAEPPAGGESEGGEGSRAPCPWGLQHSGGSSGIAPSTRCAPCLGEYGHRCCHKVVALSRVPLVACV